MRLRTVAGAALMVLAGQAFAVEAVECIRVVDRANLQNACNKKINLTYCVDNPKSGFNCRAGKGGAKTISPGNKEFIPFYTDDGGGRIWWAACFDPQGPQGWKGPGTSYTCR